MKFQRKRHRRNGAATAELALCLPLMITLVFACIETCSMIFVKQSLTIAAYEGARSALSPGATSADVRDTCNLILNDRNIQNANVSISPTLIESALPGEYLTVTIDAPCDENSLFRGFFFRSKRLEGETVMMKEY